MAAPSTGVCTSWATTADLCSPCDDYDFDQALLTESLEIASNVLYKLSGRQWPGTCSETVRPCGRRVALGDRSRSREVGIEGITVGGGVSVCSCNRSRACGCPRLSEITLGAYPIASVDEVRLRETSGGDLETFGPNDGEYRVDDYRWLVRLADSDGNNQGWPCCQRLDLDSGGGEVFFEVDFTYGTDPPAEGVRAAAVLGCELALACQPETIGECRLPRRVTEVVRQGVSIAMLEPRTFLENNLTGLIEVDLFLQSANPNRLTRRSTVLSPDRPRRVRRAGT